MVHAGLLKTITCAATGLCHLELQGRLDVSDLQDEWMQAAGSPSTERQLMNGFRCFHPIQTQIMRALVTHALSERCVVPKEQFHEGPLVDVVHFLYRSLETLNIECSLLSVIGDKLPLFDVPDGQDDAAAASADLTSEQGEVLFMIALLLTMHIVVSDAHMRQVVTDCYEGSHMAAESTMLAGLCAWFCQDCDRDWSILESPPAGPEDEEEDDKENETQEDTPIRMHGVAFNRSSSESADNTPYTTNILTDATNNTIDKQALSSSPSSMNSSSAASAQRTSMFASGRQSGTGARGDHFGENALASVCSSDLDEAVTPMMVRKGGGMVPQRLVNSKTRTEPPKQRSAATSHYGSSYTTRKPVQHHNSPVSVSYSRTSPSGTPKSRRDTPTKYMDSPGGKDAHMRLLKKEIAHMQRRHNEAMHDSDGKLAELVKRESEAVQLFREAQNKVERLQRRDEERDRLQADLTRAEEQIVVLQRQVIRANNDLCTEKKDSAVSYSQGVTDTIWYKSVSDMRIGELETQLARGRTTKRQLNDLQNELGTALAVNVQLESSVDQLRKKMSGAEEELDSYKEWMRGMKEEKVCEKQQREELQERLQQAEIDAHSLKFEYERAQEQQAAVVATAQNELGLLKQVKSALLVKQNESRLSIEGQVSKMARFQEQLMESHDREKVSQRSICELGAQLRGEEAKTMALTNELQTVNGLSSQQQTGLTEQSEELRKSGNELEVLKAEKGVVLRECDQWKEESASLSARVHAAREQHVTDEAQLTAELTGQLTLNGDLNGRVDGLMKEIEVKEEVFEGKEQRLSTELSSCQQQLTLRDGLVTEMGAEIKDKMAKLADLELQLQGQQDGREEAEKRAVENETIGQLRSELTETKEAASTQHETLSIQLASVNTQLAQTVTQHRHKLNDHQAEFASRDNQIVSLQHQVQRARQDTDEVQMQLADKQVTMSEAQHKVVKLNEKLADRDSLLEVQQNELDEQQQDNEQLGAQLTDALDETTAMKVQLERLATEVRESNEAHEGLDTELLSTRTQMSSASEVAESRAQEMQQQLDTANQQWALSADEVVEWQTEHHEAEAALRQAQSSLSSEQAKVCEWAAKYELLLAQLSSKEEALMGVREQVANAVHETTSLERVVRDTEAKLVEAQFEIVSERTRGTELLAKLECADGLLMDSERALGALREEHGTLSQEHQQLTTNLVDRDHDHEETEQKLEVMTDRLRVLEVEAVQEQQELTCVTSQLQEKTNEVGVMKQMLVENETELEVLRPMSAELVRQRKDNVGWSRAYEKLQAKLNKTQEYEARCAGMIVALQLLPELLGYVEATGSPVKHLSPNCTSDQACHYVRSIMASYSRCREHKSSVEGSEKDTQLSAAREENVQLKAQVQQLQDRVAELSEQLHEKAAGQSYQQYTSTNTGNHTYLLPSLTPARTTIKTSNRPLPLVFNSGTEQFCVGGGDEPNMMEETNVQRNGVGLDSGHEEDRYRQNCVANRPVPSCFMPDRPSQAHAIGALASSLGPLPIGSQIRAGTPSPRPKKRPQFDFGTRNPTIESPQASCDGLAGVNAARNKCQSRPDQRINYHLGMQSAPIEDFDMLDQSAGQYKPQRNVVDEQESDRDGVVGALGVQSRHGGTKKASPIRRAATRVSEILHAQPFRNKK